RLGALALNLCGGSCLLILPLANMFALLVTPKWLLAYAAIPALALMGSSTSFVLALGLFRLLGARRARVFAQILGAPVGIAAGVSFQLPSLLSNDAKAAAGQLFADFAARLPVSDSWLWLPARGFLGDLPMLAVIVVVASALFAFVTLGLADRF